MAYKGSRGPGIKVICPHKEGRRRQGPFLGSLKGWSGFTASLVYAASRMRSLDQSFAPITTSKVGSP